MSGHPATDGIASQICAHCQKRRDEHAWLGYCGDGRGKMFESPPPTTTKHEPGANIEAAVLKELYGYKTGSGWISDALDVNNFNDALGEIRIARTKTEKLAGYVRRLREELQAFVVEYGVQHEDPECPEDDTCTCPNVAKLNALLKETQR